MSGKISFRGEGINKQEKWDLSSVLLLMLVLTIAMCSIAGAIAVRKLRQADPTHIF